MKTVQVRNITIGEGRPKICVPIVGQTKEDIILCLSHDRDTDLRSSLSECDISYLNCFNNGTF